jgi:hypothetical protein
MKESPMQRFMRRPKRMLLGVALAALCLASAGVGRADSPVDQRMLRSTGVVEVPHPKGWVTYGTCWLVDRQRGRALTSQHVVSAGALWGSRRSHRGRILPHHSPHTPVDGGRSAALPASPGWRCATAARGDDYMGSSCPSHRGTTGLGLRPRQAAACRRCRCLPTMTEGRQT